MSGKPFPKKAIRIAIIESVVAVHRSRGVLSLYGLSRFEAPPTEADAELEDIRLATRAAPIGQNTGWLPAVEQRRETDVVVGSNAF